MIEGWPTGKYGAIYADPPWRFEVWSGETLVKPRDSEEIHYDTMTLADLMKLPVRQLAADDCVLFLWATWPMLRQAMALIPAWGFEYKSCAFDWMKAHAGQIELFRDDHDVQVGMGYWTRANSEPCLLATKGKPKRLNADVRMGIISPRREHSRKPDGVHERIERLVSGPYLEMWARQSTRPNWSFWGNEITKFK